MQNKKMIEKKAETLIKNYQVKEIPTPLDELAEKLGIKIQFQEFEDNISGFLFREGSKNIIGVNKNQPETRQRFTIAHEIGHFILHKGNLVHVDKKYRVNFRNENSSTAVDFEEIEANTFAASLLMPEKEVKKIVKRKLSDGIDLQDSDELKKIADYFEVSLQALIIRLIRLGIIDELELA
jgi:Zn-dependent peptidase ImmA (M78 family)